MMMALLISQCFSVDSMQLVYSTIDCDSLTIKSDPQPSIIYLNYIEVIHRGLMPLFWCTCVAINNISVQQYKRWVYLRYYNVGPMLLSFWGNRLNPMKMFCPCSECCRLNIFTIPPPLTGCGCSIILIFSRRFRCVHIYFGPKDVVSLFTGFDISLERLPG